MDIKLFQLIREIGYYHSTEILDIIIHLMNYIFSKYLVFTIF